MGYSTHILLWARELSGKLAGKSLWKGQRQQLRKLGSSPQFLRYQVSGQELLARLRPQHREQFPLGAVHLYSESNPVPGGVGSDAPRAKEG